MIRMRWGGADVAAGRRDGLGCTATSGTGKMGYIAQVGEARSAGFPTKVSPGGADFFPKVPDRFFPLDARPARAAPGISYRWGLWYRPRDRIPPGGFRVHSAFRLFQRTFGFRLLAGLVIEPSPSRPCISYIPLRDMCQPLISENFSTARIPGGRYPRAGARGAVPEAFSALPGREAFAWVRIIREMLIFRERVNDGARVDAESQAQI